MSQKAKWGRTTLRGNRNLSGRNIKLALRLHQLACLSASYPTQYRQNPLRSIDRFPRRKLDRALQIAGRKAACAVAHVRA
jgi:hypothetical protein